MASKIVIGGNAGLAGGVDDDVDFRGGDHQFGIGGDGAFAKRDGLGHLRAGRDLAGVIGIAIGDLMGGERGVGAAGGDGGDLQPLHQHALGDEIGAHFARADDADADGVAGVGAGFRDRGQGR